MSKTVVALLLLLLATPALAGPQVDALFWETDLREALFEVALQTGVNIVVGDEVVGRATLELEDAPLEEALRRLLGGTSYHFVRQDDYYLVGSGEPSSPLFPLIARTRFYRLDYLEPETAAMILEPYPAQFGFMSGSNLLSVTAVPEVLAQIELCLKELDSDDSPHQVVYGLEIVELREGVGKSLELGFGDFNLKEQVGAVFQFIFQPNVMNLPTLANIRLEAVEEEERLSRIAEPWIITGLGRPGRTRLVQEETFMLEALSHFEWKASGLDLTITPLRIDGEDRILSQVKVVASSDEATLETDLWVDDEPTLVGVMRQVASHRIAGILSGGDVHKERYFAVYLAGKPMKTPKDAGFRVGAVSGLADLLWPKESPGRLSHFQLGLPLKEEPFPELEWSYWPTATLHIKAAAIQVPYERYSLAIEKGLMKEDLRVAGEIGSNEGSSPVVALGLMETVQVAPGLTLSAGWLPLVYDTNDNELKEANWWAQGELREDKILLSLCYQQETERYLESLVGLRLTDAQLIYVAYRTDLDGGGTFLVGWRWEERKW
ncbi:MAG: secretin and TonB N-terminal domain-containing protein [Limnochordia bacterium]|jgi:hypothetical protein